MMTDEFKREERYIIIKLKDLKYASAENYLHRILREGDIPTRAGVVVESDWPEHEVVWSMIETRMAGRQWHEQFDAWNANPYTIALQESIAKDYAPKGTRAIEDEVRAEAQPLAPCPRCEEKRQTINWLSRERGKLQATVAEQGAEIERQNRAYEAIDEQRNRDFETISQQSALIDKCEKDAARYQYFRSSAAAAMYLNSTDEKLDFAIDAAIAAHKS